MAEKKPEKTLITIEIEDHTAILQSANVVVKRGTKAIIRTVKFSNNEQLAGALKTALHELATDGAAPKASSAKKAAKPEPTAKDIAKAAAPKKPSAKKGQVPDAPIATKQVSLFGE